MYGCRDPVCRLPFGNDINLHSRLDLKEMCSSLGGGRRKRKGGGQEKRKNCSKNTNMLMLVYFMWCIGRKKDLPKINFAQSKPTKTFIGKAHC